MLLKKNLDLMLFLKFYDEKFNKYNLFITNKPVNSIFFS